MAVPIVVTRLLVVRLPLVLQILVVPLAVAWLVVRLVVRLVVVLLVVVPLAGALAVAAPLVVGRIRPVAALASPAAAWVLLVLVPCSPVSPALVARFLVGLHLEQVPAPSSAFWFRTWVRNEMSCWQRRVLAAFYRVVTEPGSPHHASLFQ